nr:MAG TPA: hypothetical protein [Caudoviricetes sp.]
MSILFSHFFNIFLFFLFGQKLHGLFLVLKAKL